MTTRSCRDEHQRAIIIVRPILAPCDADALGATCYYGDRAAAAAANSRPENDFYASADW